MSWLIIALSGTVCFSFISHIDKYLISKYLKNNSIGSLMLFSSFFPILILPIIFFIEPNIFSIQIKEIVFLIFVGILSFLAIFFYFRSLTYGEASEIIPFFQLIPVFGFLLGLLILNEKIPTKSIIAGIIIIIGVTLLSFDVKRNNVKFKKSMVVLVVLSAFTYALYEVLFKFFTVTENFWISFFWQNVGLILSGLILYLFINQYRKDFIKLIKINGKNIIGINIINEILNTIGVGSIQYATLLAPITYVLLVNSIQPLIVFSIGILMTIFLPYISIEDISLRVLIQKGFAIFIIMIGTYFMYF